MYPIMIPIISSIKLFFVKAEKNSKIPMTIIAPAKAPANTARKPDILKTPAVILPPPSNITKATPRLAPVLIPNIEGPASGLLKTVCNINPETAKAAPHSKAVIPCGIRDSSKMNRQLSRSTACPHKISHTAPAGIRTEPTHKFAANNRRINTIKPILYFHPDGKDFIFPIF